jgi:alpha-amylase/alpha-mannosidase (GH57 family)
MAKSTSPKPIRLALLWHQHQPYYRAGNKFMMPWVWLHATKDYLEMAQHFESVPAMKATINLVPSLIKQIEEYLSGEVEDPLLAVLSKDTEKLTEIEKRYVLENCFHANHDRMIARSQRFLELHEQVYSDRSGALAQFKPSDYRDLLIHFALAWTGEFIRKEDSVAALIEKDRDFTEDERRTLLSLLKERVGEILAIHKRLADAGQIELSTTPFYHPIMPLLCDTNAGAQSVPGLELPSKRYREPQDASEQLERGRKYAAERFGRMPKGIWPSEGSLSEEVLEIMIEQGVEWTATDEAVLTRSLSESQGLDIKLPETNHSFAKYLPFKYLTDKGEIAVFFRDHALSDNIGFVYQSWNATDAVKDLVKHVLQVRKDLITHYGEDVLDRACISIILDGENCWEYYEKNGYDFLQELYKVLSTTHEISTCTMSDAVASIGEDKLPVLQKLTPGSWINANFNIWIGHAEDNLAWDELHKARCVVRDFEDYVETLGEGNRAAAQKKLDLAREELFIAEGSDWCWWYGDDHFSIQKDKFDDLFRMHLRAIYVYLDKRVPDSLGESIMLRAAREQSKPKPEAASRYPLVTGERTNASWAEVDVIDVRVRHGSMHRTEALALEEIRAEVIDAKFFLKLVPRGGGPKDLELSIEFREQALRYVCRPDSLELRSDGVAFKVPSIEYAWKTAVELAIHIDGLSDGRQPFAVTLSSSLIDQSVRIPEEGWLMH